MKIKVTIAFMFLGSFYSVKVSLHLGQGRYNSLCNTYFSIKNPILDKVYKSPDDRFWFDELHTEQKCISSIEELLGNLILGFNIDFGKPDIDIDGSNNKNQTNT